MGWNVLTSTCIQKIMSYLNQRDRIKYGRWLNYTGLLTETAENSGHNDARNLATSSGTVSEAWTLTGDKNGHHVDYLKSTYSWREGFRQKGAKPPRKHRINPYLRAQFTPDTLHVAHFHGYFSMQNYVQTDLRFCHSWYNFGVSEATGLTKSPDWKKWPRYSKE